MKINPAFGAILILIGGFFAFKLMSFLGCYVRIDEAQNCFNLTIFTIE